MFTNALLEFYLKSISSRILLNKKQFCGKGHDRKQNTALYAYHNGETLIYVDRLRGSFYHIEVWKVNLKAAEN